MYDSSTQESFEVRGFTPPTHRSLNGYCDRARNFPTAQKLSMARS